MSSKTLRLVPLGGLGEVDKKHKVRGIIVTHGHEDHTGAIRHLLEQLEAPIYSTPLTQGLIEAKLSRNGLLGKASLHTVHAGDRIPIGPFSVEFFHVCHSIPAGVCWPFSPIPPTPKGRAGRLPRR